MDAVCFRWARYLVLTAVLCSSVVFFEPAGYDLLFGLAFVLALFCLSQAGSFVIRNFWIGLFFCLFLGANLVSLLVNPLGKDQWFYFGITCYLAVTVFLVFFLFQEEDIRRIFWISTAGIVLTSIIGLLTYFFGGPLHTVMCGRFRLIAFFKDPNVYAGFIVPHLFFLLNELRSGRGKKLVVVLFSLAVLVPGFFLSFSRGGLINLVGGGLLFLFIIFCKGFLKTRRERNRLFAIMIVVLVAFFLSFYFQSGFSKIFLDRLHVVDNSNLSRLSTQIKGIDIWAGTHLGDGYPFVERFEERYMEGELGARGLAPVPENHLVRWLFGIGTGRYEDVINFSAHGLFVRMLVENGIFGLGVLLLSLFLVLRALYRKRDHDLAVVILCSLVGIMVQSLVIDTIHWRHFYWLLGLALVVSVKYGDEQEILPEHIFKLKSLYLMKY